MILDFSAQWHFVVALLPESVLSLAAIFILLFDVFTRRRQEPSGPWTGRLTILALLLAIGADLFLFSVQSEGRAAMVALDDYRLLANLVLLGATLVSVLFSFDYLKREALPAGEFFVLTLFATVGMMVMVGARDLILLFLGLELMSISVYVLTGMNRRDPRSAEAALKYFLFGSAASAFFLYGIALLFGATGSTNMALVGAEVAQGAVDMNPLFLAGIGLLLVGFGFKISAVPFHMWTPDVYQGAPTPVTGYMAAGVKAAGVVALVRIVTVEMGAAITVWQPVLWWLALGTMIVPNLVALAQRDVKRLIAYSSVAHAGYLLVGLAAGNAAGRSASIFYLGVYALMTMGAFAVAYVVAGAGDHGGDLDDYRGLGWRRPWLGAAMSVFLLSLAGFPPTGGFVGKLYLLRASVDGGQVALAITLVLTSFVSYYYYLRVVWKMYFEEVPEGAPAPGASGLGFRTAAVVSVVGILLAGIVPGAAIRATRVAGEQLEPERVAPLSTGGAPVTPVPVNPESRPDR